MWQLKPREVVTCGKSDDPSLLTSDRRPTPFPHTVPKAHTTDVYNRAWNSGEKKSLKDK